MKLNLRGKPLLAPVIIGLIQPVLYFFLENYGISYTTTSFSGMISSLSPIFSAILGAMVLKEKPSGKQWLFIALSIAGVLMLSLGGSGGTNTLLGVLCLIAAYFSGAIYSLLIRRYSRLFTPFELTYVMFHVGFVFFALTAFGAYRGEALPRITAALSRPEFLGAAAYLGIGCSVIAYFLVNYSLAKLPVARSTIFGHLATIVSVASGVILMGDRFTPLSLLAFALILTGIAGTNHFQRKSDPSQP